MPDRRGIGVSRITGDRLRAAYRLKKGLKFTKMPDGKQEHTWDGKGDWKWLVDKQIPSGK